VQPVFDDCAIMVPANYWHNVVNTGNEPLKLYSIYAPPDHPFGEIDVVKPE
jgi:mannose-6-phosphate isomerase-like protein (cupin superfamily)